MAKVLDMPKLSPTMEEGQISAWHKKEGDTVAVDDLLAEVETDKATMEFRAFDKGTLLKILAPAGTVVRLGEPVAIVGAPGEDVSSLVPSNGGGAPDRKEAPAGKPPAEPKADAAPPKAAAASTRAHDGAPPPSGDAPRTERAPASDAGRSAPSSGARSQALPSVPSLLPKAERSATGRVKASPYVRKLARERGLSLDGVSGSGPNGRIVARDLTSLPAASTLAPTAAPGELVAPESRPLSMMRKAIARRLTESKQTVPHFYLSIDVDADPLQALREQINLDLSSATGDDAVKVSFNDLLIKACAIALTRVPECNAQFSPEAILVHNRIDISVAVAVPEGLVTPVVRDADRKSVLEVSAEVRDLATRARAKKLRPDEMQNGTFSISNLGMYGIDDFAAVINPPEGAILAIGQVRREPVVRGETVVAGRRLGMTLSCDHRVVDGAVGATFLKTLRQLLEHPSQILLL
jgi:pyruvate dehydrogenase E2 component (dihydrolipoamide acetyltransferase)